MPDRERRPNVAVPAPVVELLEEAAALGYLGPGPVARHVDHAAGFAAALRPAPPGPPGPVVDLGSGGGVPGLVVAALCPTRALVLIDARTARTDFLARAVSRMGWDDRVRVVAARAEELGQEPALRGVASAVVARSFGPPSATAEAAAPLLAVGGQLLVSEPPPEHAARWPATGLALVGLRADNAPSDALASFTQDRPCPPRFPRRRGRPPLFELAGLPRST